MESYIEITFINDFLICLLAFYASAYFSLSKINLNIFILWILVEQFLHILIFNSIYYMYFYFFEICLYLFLFYKNYKKACMYICLKYAIMLTQFKLCNGSFHLFHYYVKTSTNIIGIWILYVFLILLLKKKWHNFIRISDFIFIVYFNTSNKLKLNAYLDTGNSLLCENIPVIFVDCKYKKYFMCENKKTIPLYSFNESKIIDVYFNQIQIDTHKKQSCYICCDERVFLPYGCECLLNIEMGE